MDGNSREDIMDLATSFPNQQPRPKGPWYVVLTRYLHSRFNTLFKHPKERDIKPLNTNKVETIIGFSFFDGGFLGGYRKIEVKTMPDKIMCKYSSSIEITGQKRKYEISKEMWDEFIIDILALNILTWNKNYYPSEFICDGEQWKLIIYLMKKKQIVFSGVNAYPEEWNEFNQLIDCYFPIMKEKDFIETVVKIGKIYVVHNDWLQNPETGIMPYKIGIIKGTVDKRYYGLGLKMPGEFVCDFAYEFFNDIDRMEAIEDLLHNRLSQLSVNDEWFNLNEEALDEIKAICERCYGMPITKEVEKEIEIATGFKPDQNFQIIIKRWNEISDLKATGSSFRKRSIHLPEIAENVYYVFRLRNTKELSIELECWAKFFPNFDKVLKAYAGMEINGHAFNCPSLTSSEGEFKMKGRIRTIIKLTEVDDIIKTMEELINLTKENVIKVCNEK
jgi:hypothetical protein